MTQPSGKWRVLIVTNGFPPTMLADMQRARMLSYDLHNAGWEAEVLTPGVEYQKPIWVEPDAVALLPKEVTVHNVPQKWAGLFSRIGIGSVGWRAFWPMYQFGCHLLRGKRFDLIYITTTQFMLFSLGRFWCRKFGVPYVLDFHDPWVRETTNYVTVPQNLKFRVSLQLAKSLECFALRRAAGLVSVSPLYLEQLKRRYPNFACTQPERHAVIPFGATPEDFEVAQTIGAKRPAAPNSDFLEIGYVGAGGSIMERSFRRIAQSLARLRKCEPELIGKVRIRLLGTYAYWVPGDPKELEAIAKQEGIGDLVDEQPARVEYLQAINHILHARGVLILGVDDPAYMPSKLFTYALTGKPLLACLRHDSQANQYFQKIPGLGRLIHFGVGAAQESSQDEQVHLFIHEVAARQSFNRKEQIAPYLSPASARRHAALFEACLS